MLQGDARLAGTQAGVVGMRRFVWLNQYADQFLPILALVTLRVVVGAGDALLRAVTRPKKDPMQARAEALSKNPKPCRSSTPRPYPHARASFFPVLSRH